MTIPEFIAAAIVAGVVAIVTTVLGIVASRRFGMPGVARLVDAQEAKLIDRMQARLELAEEDVKTLTVKADAAERKAIEAESKVIETERRRLGCEDEILRLKSDVRALEGELLDLHRKTRTPAPAALVNRHEEHKREDEA